MNQTTLRGNAEDARRALILAYREQADALSRAALDLAMTQVDELARKGKPLPHIGGPRLRPYEEALDRALMAL